MLARFGGRVWCHVCWAVPLDGARIRPPHTEVVGVLLWRNLCVDLAVPYHRDQNLYSCMYLVLMLMTSIRLRATAMCSRAAAEGKVLLLWLVRNVVAGLFLSMLYLHAPGLTTSIIVEMSVADRRNLIRTLTNQNVLVPHEHHAEYERDTFD